MQQQATTGISYFGSDTRAPSTCSHTYRTKEELGRGLYGTVFQACKMSDCSYVVKVEIVQPPESKLPEYLPGTERASVTLDNFQREVALSDKAASLRVGPKVYESWLCKHNVAIDSNEGYWLGFLVMQRLDADLGSWALQHPELYIQWRSSLIDHVTKLVATLHAGGISHNDIKPANIALSLDDFAQPTKLFLIDYGEAQLLQEQDGRKFDHDSVRRGFAMLDQEVKQLLFGEHKLGEY